VVVLFWLLIAILLELLALGLLFIFLRVNRSSWIRGADPGVRLRRRLRRGGLPDPRFTPD
jgi:hypothetical protein